ncbi:hypothetical protein [Sulfurimonas sp.]
MAKASIDKYKKLNSDEKEKTTHADLQKKKPGRQPGSKTKEEQANVSLSVALTPSQKKQLVEYAQQDDRTAGYVIKKLLIKEGIIEENKKIGK